MANISEYNYNLADKKIAQYPLDIRDNSKLLILKNNDISEDKFYNIANYLPENSIIIFNNTKVIPARLFFKKETGALIEILCLNPYKNKDYQIAFSEKGNCKWDCMIGNAKKWKTGILKIKVDNIELIAEKIASNQDGYTIKFSWLPENLSFSDIISLVGHIPLPPYINRPDEISDKEKYQTIFANYDGSVAAPTAGLHFTPQVFSSLDKKNISKGFITLHVGAGTFKPVTTSIEEHQMHTEFFSMTKDFIEKLLSNLSNTIIAVGTTTVRTLESLYLVGVKLIMSDFLDDTLHISQWYPYENINNSITPSESLSAIIKYLETKKTNTLNASTSLMIRPGYKFAFPTAIITNFHQPQSTLLLLVSAFIGDKWKEAYGYALSNDFRFLSYGDCCLFWR